MLQEKELNTRSAGRYAYAAAVDANRYSDECRMRYNGSERARVETFVDLVNMAYSARVFTNYRKKWVQVFLKDVIVRDRKWARELDNIIEERNYEKVRTESGVSIRMRLH